MFDTFRDIIENMDNVFRAERDGYTIFMRVDEGDYEEAWASDLIDIINKTIRIEVEVDDIDPVCFIDIERKTNDTTNQCGDEQAPGSHQTASSAA